MNLSDSHRLFSRIVDNWIFKALEQMLSHVFENFRVSIFLIYQFCGEFLNLKTKLPIFLSL